MQWLSTALPWLLIGAATGGWWSSRKRVARAVAAANARSAATALAQGGSVVIGSIGRSGDSELQAALDGGAWSFDPVKLHDGRTVIDYNRGPRDLDVAAWLDGLRERESLGRGSDPGGRVRHPRPPVVIGKDGELTPCPIVPRSTAIERP